MGVNRAKVDLWKADVARSVDFYNEWFMVFAPNAFRETRIETTNTNKRRKEEAVKIQQLRKTYGNKIAFDLFLCGYFDSGYLGYEAAEGIDWVWEHRIDDLAQFGF